MHMERCSTSPIIINREMQIRTTVRYHLTLMAIRMAIIKKSINNKCWTECGEKGIFLHCGECKLAQQLYRTVWWLLKKLKIELSHDPTIPLLGIYTEKILIGKDTCISMLIVALFTIAKTWKNLS